jgi:uncharacterized protein YecE (DUF72 family)
MVDWHIGCSGFHYKDWKGPFYPADLPQRKWFEYYCQHFNTLELNVTFYRFPELSFLQNWYQKSPGDFRFSVKVPRAITHNKKFNDTADLINSLYETINNGLKEKLGPVLFQMPPSYNYTDERLDKIVSSLNPSFKNVLEFRHVSWWCDDVYKKLTEHHITFCGMSHPLLPDDVIVNTDVVYYRFHGVPILYRSRYSIEFLQKIVNDIKQHSNVNEAWCYFNNDYDAIGVFNAREMIGLI